MLFVFRRTRIFQSNAESRVRNEIIKILLYKSSFILNLTWVPIIHIAEQRLHERPLTSGG